MATRPLLASLRLTRTRAANPVTTATAPRMIPPNTAAMAPKMPSTAAIAAAISAVMDQGSNSSVNHSATVPLINEATPKPSLGPTFSATGIAVCQTRPSQYRFPGFPVGSGYQPGGGATGWGNSPGSGDAGTGARLMRATRPN